MRSFNLFTLAAFAAFAFGAPTGAPVPGSSGSLVDVSHNTIKPDTKVDVLRRGGSLVNVEGNNISPNTDVEALDGRGESLINVSDNNISPDTKVNALNARGGSLVNVEHNDISPNTDVDVGKRDDIKSIPTILNDLLTDLGTVVDELSK